MNDTGLRENLRGILAMTACNLLFLSCDTAMKLVSGSMPLTQILFIRGIFAVPILLVLVLLTGAHRKIRLIMNWPMFWRVTGEVVSAFLFLVALFNIPIANANAILQIVPLAITAAGAIFLAEVVGWRRWTAIIVGFLGVVVIIRPGFEGFDAYSLLAIGAVFCITLRDLMTRAIPAAAPALLISLVTGVAVCLSGPVVGLAIGDVWVMPSGNSLILLLIASFFLCGGYLTSVVAMRHGDISVVAPFRYTVIVFAMIIGFVVWGDIPDLWMIVGTVIIAATGVYTFSRERNLARLRTEAESGQGL